MDSTLLASFLIWYVVFVFSTTTHEAAHSLVAYLGGDRTAYEGGQVSLDPMPHIRRSPFGMVVIPIITFLLSSGGYMFGFASAPFNMLWAQRNPRKYSLMSFAGPAANFVLAFVAFILMVVLVKAELLMLNPRFGFDDIVVARPAPGATLSDQPGPLGALAMMLSVMFSLNIFLGLFNLLPVPPLDGAAVLEGAFPRSLGSFFQRLRQSPIAALIGLVVIFQFGGRLIFPLFEFVLLKALPFLAA